MVLPAPPLVVSVWSWDEVLYMEESVMITLIVIIICFYCHVFSDWTFTGDAGAALFLATLVELMVEGILACLYFGRDR